MSKWTTHTGHAISAGRSTRRSKLLRKTFRQGRGKKQPPLPVELACHPQYLTPTPVNPSCVKRTCPYGGKAIELANALTRNQFLNGKGLANTGKYVLTLDTEDLGYANDLNYAMAWRLAAVTHGLWVDVVEC